MVLIVDLVLISISTSIGTELVKLLSVDKFAINMILATIPSIVLHLHQVLTSYIWRIFKVPLRLHQLLVDIFIDNSIMLPLCNVGVHIRRVFIGHLILGIVFMYRVVCCCIFWQTLRWID